MSKPIKLERLERLLRLCRQSIDRLEDTYPTATPEHPRLKTIHKRMAFIKRLARPIWSQQVIDSRGNMLLRLG